MYEDTSYKSTYNVTDNSLYMDMDLPKSSPVTQQHTRKCSNYEGMDSIVLASDIFLLRKELLGLIYNKATEDEHKAVVKKILACHHDVNDKYCYLDFRNLLEKNKVGFSHFNYFYLLIYHNY